MTSYQIAAHVDREIHPSYLPGATSSANGTTSAPPTTSSADLAATTTPAAAADDESPAEAEYDARCVFCRIVRKEQNAYPVWEDEHTLAFLDLMPIRPGHTLLIPKTHCARISDLDPQVGARIGAAMPQITKAITKAMDNDDLNVVLNQGYAQAVHHAHFHLIPAPHPSHTLARLRASSPSASPATSAKPRRERKVSEWTAAELRADPPSHAEMLRGETEARSGYLSARDGQAISARIRSCL